MFIAIVFMPLPKRKILVVCIKKQFLPFYLAFYGHKHGFRFDVETKEYVIRQIIVIKDEFVY